MSNQSHKCGGDGCQGCAACMSSDERVASDTPAGCPKCRSNQSGPIEDGYRHWECESFAHASGECFEESKLCRALQRLEKLLAFSKAAVIAYGSESEGDAIGQLGGFIADDFYPQRNQR